MTQDNTTITGQTIIEMGFEQGKAVGFALEAIAKHYHGLSLTEITELFTLVRQTPENYLEDPKLSELAESLMKKEDPIIPINDQPGDYTVYGAEGIEGGAIRQIETAMRLPVATAGALMPDAHQGYGLPIGGVLATKNAVIPYGVGVDIGCRMCMTLYDIPSSYIDEERTALKTMLTENTKFGKAAFKRPKDHEVLAHPLFNEIALLKNLQQRAASQIGSSGGGNHFVEFGATTIFDEHNEFGVKPGKYLALLSHSGSRGFGANIAKHYTQLAMSLCQLPKEARHLAWLDLDTEAGQEYWQAMNLAGDYASACHHQIHERMAASLQAQPVAMIENHHNFAWKEQDSQGNEIIVHRKGATPAGKGVLGIIPGSMTAPGFIVRGKGEAASINSASHGAGRAMSRTQAKNSIDPKTVKEQLEQAGVTLIGAGLDEAPMAYKNIKQVMAAQQNLVDVVGDFLPKVVRMCGDEQFKEVD